MFSFWVWVPVLYLKVAGRRTKQVLHTISVANSELLNIHIANITAQEGRMVLSRIPGISGNWAHVQTVDTRPLERAWKWSYSLPSTTNMHPHLRLFSPQPHTRFLHSQAIKDWHLFIFVLVLVTVSTAILIYMEAADMYVANPIEDQESPTTRNVC